MSESEKAGKTATSGRRMTVRQAAEEWQLHPETVRAAIRKGELSAIWAGRGYRMLASEVETWVRLKWQAPH